MFTLRLCLCQTVRFISLHDSYKTFKSKFVNILTRFQPENNDQLTCQLTAP